MNKKISLKIFIVLLVLVISLFIASSALATETETDPNAVKMGIPGGPSTYNEPQGLQTYISALFTWAISVAGVCALIMVIFGGYQYMASAANPELRKVAKNTITQALIGLAIAICTLLLLKTIDPSILGLNFDVPKMEPGVSGYGR